MHRASFIVTVVLAGMPNETTVRRPRRVPFVDRELELGAQRRYLLFTMLPSDETSEDSLRAPDRSLRSVPGIVVLLAAGLPATIALKLGPEGMEIGRGTPADVFHDDDRASRRHARIRRAGARWEITDLGSRNGTFVNGKPLTATEIVGSSPLVRIGRSLCWLVENVVPFLDGPAGGSIAEGPVIGGRLRQAWGDIALASRAADTLCIQGESGSGKELAARAFHEAQHGSSASAPFVAINCAAIPEGLAERLLFGARRGAYSGAIADAEGYVQAADQGTLFLDEIAELDPLVQAKLLRVLESREVLPLGASRPRKVEIRICAASHKSLRDEVSGGRFREDLYYRLGRPEVRIPPLRERLDEIPWLVARALAAVDKRLAASTALIELCALATWPGNVRELVREVRRAGHHALAEHVVSVQPRHLPADAGILLRRDAPDKEHAPEQDGESSEPPKYKMPRLGKEQIVSALAEHGGNVRGTARALGLHRNQLRRWLDKNQLGDNETED